MKYLYIFGFNTPKQWINNQRNGLDDEDSLALFIEAPSENEAIQWGNEIAEEFVAQLFKDEDSRPSWKQGNFANWIEHEPLQRYSGIALETFPVVKFGEVPDFDDLLKSCYKNARLAR